jgi:hypothetical protein
MNAKGHEYVEAIMALPEKAILRALVEQSVILAGRRLAEGGLEYSEAEVTAASLLLLRVKVMADAKASAARERQRRHGLQSVRDVGIMQESAAESGPSAF